jgi:signal transduction histidine kinase
MPILKDSQTLFGGSHEFIDITGISIDSVMRRIVQLPDDGMVVIVSYNEDINGLPFTTPEVANLIAKVSKVPFFILGGDSFPKDGGAIGGYVINYINVGREFGRAANQIIRGADPESIAIDNSLLYQYIFDWRELKKWDLLESKAIPAQSIFLNQEHSFFYLYKWYIIGLTVFMVLQTLIIIYLIRAYKTQKRVKQQLLENQVMFNRIVREDRLSKMTTLTASLSHELNQPLTAILSFAQAGIRFLDSDMLDKEQAREIFQNIVEDDSRAVGIISSVRSLMKLEIREKENVNINSLVNEALEIMHYEMFIHGIKITTRLENRPVLVLADKIQLQQVLLNFLRNSIDALDRVDTGEKRIEVSVVQESDSVKVSVRDTGPGIDMSILEKVFQPFVTSGKTGFGIGLAISRSIIENHKGEIGAKNIQGGGAEFSFRLTTLKNE